MTVGNQTQSMASGSTVRIEGDSIIVSEITLVDAELAGYLAEHPEGDRVNLAERALRVGLISLRNAGVTLNVDFVAKEFDRLMQRTHETNEKAAGVLDTALREAFADGQGHLPRTLERFLGDRGTLQRFVEDLFDEGLATRRPAARRSRSMAST